MRSLSFNKRLELAKVILKALENGPVRRVNLLKHVILACGSPARFRTVFDWLKQKGYIRKSGPGHFDPYEITSHGLRFLKGLKNESETGKGDLISRRRTVKIAAKEVKVRK